MAFTIRYWLIQPDGTVQETAHPVLIRTRNQCANIVCELLASPDVVRVEITQAVPSADDPRR